MRRRTKGREVVREPRLRLWPRARTAAGRGPRGAPPGPDVASSCDGALLDVSTSWTSSGIRKRQPVRRIITLEKKTSPMNRPMPRCNPIVAMAPRLPGAAWPDEKRVADLHHQRAPACEHRDPGMPRQPAEIESAKGGLRDRLPDGLAVPPLSPHGLVETGGEIDHAKVELASPSDNRRESSPLGVGRPTETRTSRRARTERRRDRRGTYWPADRRRRQTQTRSSRGLR